VRSPLYCRQGVRLIEPSPKTIEQSVAGGNLYVTVTMPFGILNKWLPLMPSSGPDVLVINYADTLGQVGIVSRNVTFWMSDSGYVFVSSDGSTQFLIGGVDGPFFDANALAVNARNVTALAAALLPCCNPARYDAAVLVTGQVRPVTWIHDGVLLS
jgi:hypothetical protein